MFDWFKKAPAPLHPSGYRRGLGAPAAVVDVVVHLVREARVVDIDGNVRAQRKGRGLALPDGSALAVLSQATAAGMAGSAELTIASAEFRGALLATVIRRGEGRYDIGAADRPLRFAQLIDSATAREIGCPTADFGGIWDLADDQGSIARDVPYFDGGRGQATSTIEIYRPILPLPLLVLLLFARATLAQPGHANPG